MSGSPSPGSYQVALGYDQLPDVCIEDLPIGSLARNGLIFIWVINAKYAKAFELMTRWGYTYVKERMRTHTLSSAPHRQGAAGTSTALTGSSRR